MFVSSGMLGPAPLRKRGRTLGLGFRGGVHRSLDPTLGRTEAQGAFHFHNPLLMDRGNLAVAARPVALVVLGASQVRTQCNR